MLCYITWNMDPEIFRAGTFALRWYGVFFASGIISAYVVLKYFYKKENIPQNKLEILAFYVVSGLIVGARLGHCLFYDPSYYLTHPLEILKVWKGGLASHGAAIGILISLYIYSKTEKKKILTLLDRIVLVVPLGGAFIRIGNLFNSEIIGKPTDVPWAFIFTRIDSLPRHPAQFYEAMAYVIIFLILIYVYNQAFHKNEDGFLTGLAFILIFTSRFIIEFLKERQSEFETVLPLPMGQLLSIPFIIGGIVLFIKSNSNTKKQNRN